MQSPVSLRVGAFAGPKPSRRASCILVSGVVSNGWYGMIAAHVFTYVPGARRCEPTPTKPASCSRPLHPLIRRLESGRWDPGPKLCWSVRVGGQVGGIAEWPLPGWAGGRMGKWADGQVGGVAELAATRMPH